VGAVQLIKIDVRELKLYLVILVGTPGAYEAISVKISDIGPVPTWLMAATVNI